MKLNWIEVVNLIEGKMMVSCCYGGEKWLTQVIVLQMNETFYEIIVTGRGHCFHAMVGIHAYGAFLCVPSWQFGCELASFSDKFYTRERVMRSLDAYIAETLSCAVSLLHNIKLVY